MRLAPSTASTLGLISALTFTTSACASRKFNPTEPEETTLSQAAGEETVECDVIVAGGTTAAAATAIAAAQYFKSKGASKRVVCLTEPTDWVGGQLTASGVPAVDFAHHKVDVKPSLPGTTPADPVSKPPLINLSILGRLKANQPSILADLMTGPPFVNNTAKSRFEYNEDPGACWVSVRCYRPADLLPEIEARLADYPAIKIYRNTVVKSVAMADGASDFIASVETIQRAWCEGRTTAECEDDLAAGTRPAGFGEWGRRLTDRLGQWYSRAPDGNFKAKRIRRLTGPGASLPVVVDATEWGEILALSDASYTQGVEYLPSEAPSSAKELWGQAIVFPLALRMGVNPYSDDTGVLKDVLARAVQGRRPHFISASVRFGADKTGDTNALLAAYQAANTSSGAGSSEADYLQRKLEDEFLKVWTYRRMKAGSGTPKALVTDADEDWNWDEATGTFLFGPQKGRGWKNRDQAWQGDLSNQNWTDGNDYWDEYFLLSKADAVAQRTDWMGGVNITALKGAEARAFSWLRYLRSLPIATAPFVTVSDAFGTANGLAKLPYIRDTRRSVGYRGFTLKYQPKEGLFYGYRWPDAIAIGAYEADIHQGGNDGGADYALPKYISNALGGKWARPWPFSIPFRALTSQNRRNLLVAGKTMAQSFLVNSATRLHPIEWSTGVGAGVSAAYLAVNAKGSDFGGKPDVHVVARSAEAVYRTDRVKPETEPEAPDCPSLYADNDGHIGTIQHAIDPVLKRAKVDKRLAPLCFEGLEEARQD